MGPPRSSTLGPTRAAPPPLKLEASARALCAIALPIILAELSETILEATDTAFLGRFGSLELAAVGLGAAIYEVAVFFTFGLADAIQIIAARRAGQGRPGPSEKPSSTGRACCWPRRSPCCCFCGSALRTSPSG